MDDPSTFGGVLGLVTHLGLIPVVNKHYRLALCGYGTRMICFAVLDTKNNIIYSAAHTWDKTGIRLVRFVNTPREDSYAALNHRLVMGGSDVVKSFYHETINNRIPIMKPLSVSEFRISSRERDSTTRLQSLLDGSFHPVTAWVTVSDRLGVEIATTTYPGHSGLGFVDDNGGLYIVSGGRGGDFERTFLSYATD